MCVGVLCSSDVLVLVNVHMYKSTSLLTPAHPVCTCRVVSGATLIHLTKGAVHEMGSFGAEEVQNLLSRVEQLTNHVRHHRQTMHSISKRVVSTADDAQHSAPMLHTVHSGTCTKLGSKVRMCLSP